MEPKLCLECRHCYLDWGFYGTEVTPSEPMEFKCRLGYWDATNQEPTAPGLLTLIKKAAKCTQFGEHKK